MVSESELLRRSISARARSLSLGAPLGAPFGAVALATFGSQANIASALGDVTPQAVDASKLNGNANNSFVGRIALSHGARAVGK